MYDEAFTLTIIISSSGSGSGSGSGRGSGNGRVNCSGGGGDGFLGCHRTWASFVHFLKDTVESHPGSNTITLQHCSQVLDLVLQVPPMAVV